MNRSELARRYNVSLPTVDSWVRRGCPHVRTGAGGYQFDLEAVATWRAQRLVEDSRRREGGDERRPRPRPVAPEAKQILEGLILPRDQIMPWLHENVVTFPEYARHAELSEGELFTLMLYGLPLLPPARGEKLARVSIPHADRWRALFAAWVEGLGGDGYSANLGAEAQRLRGLPPADDAAA